MREAIFRQADVQLARALHTGARRGREEGWCYAEWEDYPASVQTFITAHLPDSA
ncbi:hypothetical protein AB0J52_14710 [Spirillospora sp. NPDC049652]